MISLYVGVANWYECNSSWLEVCSTSLSLVSNKMDTWKKRESNYGNDADFQIQEILVEENVIDVLNQSIDLDIVVKLKFNVIGRIYHNNSVVEESIPYEHITKVIGIHKFSFANYLECTYLKG